MTTGQFKGLFSATVDDIPGSKLVDVRTHMTPEELNEFDEALQQEGITPKKVRAFKDGPDTHTPALSPVITREYLADLNALLGIADDDDEQARIASEAEAKEFKKREKELSDLDNEIGKRLSRHHFWEFCLYYDFEFFSRRPFLKAVALIFQWVYTEYMAGRPRRVSVSMPPRAGKSYITSLFCAWWLGRLPTLSVMRNTCTARLYMKFSYDVRKIVKSDKYKGVFPESRLSVDKQNVEGWNLTEAKQVSYFGAGVGGTIIGFGANIAITDDLYSGMEDALSETYNEKVHMWKESDHDSRKERNCPEIFIGTRWTVRDVIGKALESGKIDKTVKQPALVVNERGDLVSFCDDVKTTAEYLDMKENTEESIWLAEWMQEPIEAKGLLFPKSGLHFFNRRNVDLTNPDFKAMYVDPADEGSDDLSAPYGYLIGNRIYLPAVIYNKDNTDVNQPVIVDRLIKDKANACVVEGNSAWAMFGRAIRAAVQEVNADCEIRIISNSVNKHTRILAMAAFIRNRFWFDEDYEKDPQYRAFMKNLTSYLKEGKTKHDDAPDSLAGLARFFMRNFDHIFGATSNKPQEAAL